MVRSYSHSLRTPGTSRSLGGRFRNSRRAGGFTLVEILIVVIILGILAAIVIPQFTNASTDARKNSVISQLQTLRGAIQLYKLQHNDKLPALATDWSQFLGKTDVNGTVSAGGTFGPYIQSTPRNPLNSNTAVIDSAATPTATTAWVFDATSGNITATNQTATVAFDESTGVVQ